MSEIIERYKNGDFDPDEIRRPIPLERGKTYSIECDKGEEDDLSHAESDESNASSDVEALAQAEIAAVCDKPLQMDNRWLQNISNNKIHRGRLHVEELTACGNFIGATIVLMACGVEDFDPSLDYCFNCFGKTEEKRRETVRLMNEPLEDFLRGDRSNFFSH